MFEGNERFVGRTLYYTRRQSGLSHKKLSELSGVDVATIRAMEYGRLNSMEDYQKLVTAMMRYEKKDDMP